MTGNNDSNAQPRKDTEFFLDECLPWKVAGYLNQVGHRITSWHEEFLGQQGIKDTPLIRHLGDRGLTWITKDDEAKKEHEDDIRRAGISVVWVRGLARTKRSVPAKNVINLKDLHRMLTDKLDEISDRVVSSKGPLYHRLWISSGKPVLQKISLESFFRSI